MRKLILILCCFPLLMAATCEDEDDTQIALSECTDEVIAGVNVKVKDAETGAFLSDGVSITIQDGAYSEVLDLISDSQPPVFQGAWERAGSYTFTVQKQGYSGLQTNGFLVTANPCHVNTRSLTFELTPL